ncbi:hypothetical protein BGZ61DRAFT_441123 [Ilyonectria robusta]|uniref:uncharacterized protein n=1 Tax=Ilyonectria robusta TaxID=1079257 RepID=UPI001E8D673F|nr:uncharacterized protein BGZ61DRAFT_441123 [Ilyonectria robusta]KAH8735885.1 hypothetical protein BGZ61DRAFT_441123 [Ilyonectria robusta]
MGAATLSPTRNPRTPLFVARSPGLIRVDKLSCIIGNDLSTHVSKKRDTLSQVDLQGLLTGNLGSTAPYVSRHLGPIAATTAPWPATKETNKQEGSSLGLTWANMTWMFGVAVEGAAVSRCSVSDSASDSASTNSRYPRLGRLRGGVPGIRTRGGARFNCW